MTEIEGKIVPPEEGRRIGIVVSRFNELVTEKLLDGAVAALVRHGGSSGIVDVARVPGAFEVPLIAKSMAKSGRYAAVLCLGCVIRGATDHFDYVCGPTASGIMQAGLESGVPVIFGVLTTETLEQALDRAGAKAGNKGAEAMVTALEMANLLIQLSDSQTPG